MSFDTAILIFDFRIIDDQRKRQANHKRRIQRNFGEAKQSDDRRGQQRVKPQQFRPFQRFHLGIDNRILRVCACRIANVTGAALFLQHSHEGGKGDYNNQAYNLKRD